MQFRSRRFAGPLALLALLVGFAAGAQEPIADNMDILREKIAADKKLLIASNLSLTESQAAAFWPIYEAYQQDLTALNQRLAALIKNYADAYNTGNVTDVKADELVAEALAIEEVDVELKKKYAERLDGVVPAIERARYLQMEKKIRALIDYDMAANIPLVD